MFQKFPELKVVLIESGFTWLPHFLWRAGKTWRGVRPEVPWIDRPPAEIVRDHVRFTLQPVDAPKAEPEVLARTLEHMGSDDLLLFSTDYPHWQFDGRGRLAGRARRGHNAEDADRQCARRPIRGCARRRQDGPRPRRGDGVMNVAGPAAGGGAAAQGRRLRHPPRPTRTPTELYPFLSQRWREHWSTFGTFSGQALIGQLPFPRMMAGGMRVDSFPETAARRAPTWS